MTTLRGGVLFGKIVRSRSVRAGLIGDLPERESGMAMFHCYHCTNDFEHAGAGSSQPGASPPCPVCGAEGEPVVVRLETIHFDPPTKTPGRGMNCAACDPALRVGLCPDRFTGERAAVTCAACKETDEFKTAPAPSFDWVTRLRWKKIP